jgi:TraM recognition site of TraD and TraG
MEQNFSYEGKNFSSAEEELKYLKEMISQKEAVLTSEPESAEREKEMDKIISEEVKDYSVADASKVLHEDFKVSESKAEEIILDLSPETHDKKMEELLSMLLEKGILNTIKIAQGFGNPHIESDFHRFLVEYVKKGYTTPGLKEKSPLDKTLRKTVFEIQLPENKARDSDQKKALKELLSSMEQFYSGMLAVSGGGSTGQSSEENQFSIELSMSEGGEEFIFYVAIPDHKVQLFEKQFLSIFPDAKIVEKKDEYNIFNPDGITLASEASLTKKEVFPIKTYDQFDYDPLNVILNTFSKMDKFGEGAAIQVIFNPIGDYYNKLYKKSLDDVQKGDKLKEAIDIQHTVFGELKKTAKKEFKTIWKEMVLGKDSKDEDKKPVDTIAVEQITNKLSSPVIESNIRVIVSASNREKAESTLTEIESSFNQFNNALGNAVKFKRKKDNDLIELLHNFSYRVFDKNSILPMSLKELTTLMHFPVESVVIDSQLRQTKASTAPAPIGLSKEGIYMGENVHRNLKTPIYFAKEDRLRHFYSIGQTGTGKSTMLRNMIIQDIKNGEGVCFIDPHGSDVQDILSHIPPERYDDVIYFDPSYVDRPMALNMLEYNVDIPQQKIFVVNELFGIFQKLYSGSPESMGPMFEQYFRNATMLVVEDPETGCTLLDVSRVMADKKFRDLKLSRCKNPIVVQFWREQAEKAGGEASLANMVPYITSKFDVFLSNDIMRPIIAQEKSSFNFRDVMDNKKILLVNLAKGALGDINSSLIGLVLVGKILMAALSRVDSFGKDFPPFYLYIDEFHNITTPAISTILSEARKYKLSLSMAHQHISQLDEKIKDSVFGNVGNLAVLRVSSEDAEFLEKQFSPVFTAKDIMNIDNMNVYLKMLSDGRPVRPFSVEFTWPKGGNKEIVNNLKELSYFKYGQDREIVEDEIARKFKKEEILPTPGLAKNPFADLV